MHAVYTLRTSFASTQLSRKAARAHWVPAILCQALAQPEAKRLIRCARSLTMDGCDADTEGLIALLEPPTRLGCSTKPPPLQGAAKMRLMLEGLWVALR